jgi:hypothetical protein
MRPRVELALGAGGFLVAALAVGALGLRSGVATAVDVRRSTYLTGPAGARGLADALTRLGVRVERLRRNPAWLPPDSLRGRDLVLAELGPSDGLGQGEGIAIATRAGGSVDLLLAGAEADAAMRCFGWRVHPRLRPVPVRAAGDTGGGGREGGSGQFTVVAVLVPASATLARDSAAAASGEVLECRVPRVEHADTLLAASGGIPAAVRLRLPDGRHVTLVADDGLFSNRALRETDAGPFALSLIAGRYRRVLVDEFHHGYGPSGSLAGAVLRWSAGTPWGWAVWQLIGVGVLALLAAGRRFGPVRSGIERRRRSPMEHVHALATALASARGHDVAVRLLVQGLRRRLGRGAPGGTQAARSDPRPWLRGVATRARTPHGRAAADELLQRLEQPQPLDGVLRSADLVEDLWTDLTPPRQPK